MAENQSRDWKSYGNLGKEAFPRNLQLLNQTSITVWKSIENIDNLSIFQIWIFKESQIIPDPDV